MSDYEKRGKAYYEANKSEILAKEKEKQRWLSYYYRNKEVVREKNRKRYYEKRGLAPPPRKEPLALPDTAKLDRVEAIIAELHELVPGLVRPKAKKTKKPVETAPVNEVVIE